jgi:hypothetical protein
VQPTLWPSGASAVVYVAAAALLVSLAAEAVGWWEGHHLATTDPEYGELRGAFIAALGGVVTVIGSFVAASWLPVPDVVRPWCGALVASVAAVAQFVVVVRVRRRTTRQSPRRKPTQIGWRPPRPPCCEPT